MASGYAIYWTLILMMLLLMFMLVTRAIFDRRCGECRRYINRRARICPYCKITQ